MNDIKISTKLSILIAILAVLMVSIGFIGLFGNSQSSASLKTVYEDRAVPLAQLSEMQYLQLRNQMAVANAIITPAPEVIQKNIAEIDANIAQVTKIWEAYMATYLTHEEAIIAKAYGEKRADFVQQGLRPAQEALRANDIVAAQKVWVEKIGPLYQGVREQALPLMELQVKVPQQEFLRAENRSILIRNSFIALIVGGWFLPCFLV